MAISRLIRVFPLLLICSTLALGQSASQTGFLVKAIDKTVDPGVDFFKYATGTWMKENPIPESERSWTIGQLVQEETYNRLRSILEEAAKGGAAKGSSKQKIGDYFAAGMDTVALNRLGVKPLSKQLKQIDAIKDKHALVLQAAKLQVIGVAAMYNMGVEQDAKNSDQMGLYLIQGGLGLPEREYYFKTDSRTENIRMEYKKHVAKLLAISGDGSNKADAVSDEIYKIEKYLADSSRKLEDLRDPYANYNKKSMTELSKLYPNLCFNEALAEMGVKKIDSVIIGQPEFFSRLDRAITDFPLSSWKNYLKWHLLNEFASKLGSDFDNERFHFRSTVMNGVQKQRPRWKRMMDVVESGMGELLGQIYVEKYYSVNTKHRYEKLVDDIIAAYRERILKLDWMSEQTKQKALHKLGLINKKVGFPDKWIDFSTLKIARGQFLENYIQINKFWFNRGLAKLGKPVDRTEWSMTPQTYNAYYNPSNNEIVLPAAIFIIPGVPDSVLDDAIVYSYAGGSTIGHELTHGFDDEGRQFDAKGNLSDWWTADDVEKFNAKAKVMIDQFNDYIVLDSMHINGEATLGENIADLGGVLLGFDAFKKTAQYREGKSIDGFTPEQRFWLGYAYSWLGHQRPGVIAQQVLTDVHPPAFLRINGPLSNIPEFYKSFNIEQGKPMYRAAEKRVKIW